MVFYPLTNQGDCEGLEMSRKRFLPIRSPNVPRREKKSVLLQTISKSNLTNHQSPKTYEKLLLLLVAL